MNDFGDSVSFEIVRIFSFRYRLFVARHRRPRVRSVLGLCEPDSEIVRGTLGVVTRSVPPTRLPVFIPCQSLSSSSMCSFNVGRCPSVPSRTWRMSISLAQMLSFWRAHPDTCDVC